MWHVEFFARNVNENLCPKWHISKFLSCSGTAFRQAGANPYLIRTIYCQLNRAEPNHLCVWSFLSSTSSLLVENRGTDEKGV